MDGVPVKKLFPFLWWISVMSRSNRKKDCEVAGAAQKSIVPAGTPEWVTPELVETTIRIWQPYYEARLTPDDAVTMILNVGRLYEAFGRESSP